MTELMTYSCVYDSGS